MKKTTFTLLLSFAFCWLAAQCPTNISFTSQGQVDSFPKNWPNCSKIPGNVVISGKGIVGLDSLFSLKKIGGRFGISGTGLADLTGLNQLDSVKFDFAIHNNAYLTALSGLENLQFVGKYKQGDGFSYWEYGFDISSNGHLASLSGLGNLRTLAGCLTIAGSDTLKSLTGLGQLTYIGGCYGASDMAGSEWGEGLRVGGNASLISLDGLSAFDSLPGLNISNNPLLTSISSLLGLRKVQFNMSISNNTLLKSLAGLDSLRFAGSVSIGNDSLQTLHALKKLENVGGLRIRQTSALVSLTGLEALKTVGGMLDITENASLQTLSGLEHLDSIGGMLRIGQNASLVSLGGLEGLQSIGISRWGFLYSSLMLTDNPQLTSIQALDKVKFRLPFGTLKVIEIKTCPNLAVCHVQSICENLARVTASDNAPGCNSVAEVEAACTVSIEETSGGEPVVVFSPNPAGDFLQIQIEDNEKWDISIFDLQGRQMYRQRVPGNQIIEVKDWLPGIYALRAVSGARVFSGKIVKQ